MEVWAVFFCTFPTVSEKKRVKLISEKSGTSGKKYLVYNKGCNSAPTG